MKKILVTGASGFIGKAALKKLLDQGFEVHAISSTIPSGFKDKIFWHHADLLQENTSTNLLADIRPSHLLGLAWYTEPGLYWSSLKNFEWVKASISLLEAFTKHGGKRVVFAGTCAEYDWSFPICSEASTPLIPKTIYGQCKQALQAFSSAYCQAYNVSFAWGRIFFLYGPSEHPSRLIPNVIHSLIKQESVSCTTCEQIRDFLHVDDVGDAFATLVDSEITGPINIASGNAIQLKDLVNYIASKLERPDLIQFGARPIPLGEPMRLVADVKRLSSELNWKPTKELYSSLDSLIEYWKKNL